MDIKELEDFYYETGEDWHLWDEQELGPYPIQRIFDAMKKFIDSKKSIVKPESKINEDPNAAWNWKKD